MPDALNPLLPELGPGAEGVHVVSLPEGDPIAVFQAGLLSLPRHGFVPIVAERGGQARLSPAIRGRHVLIACRMADARAVAIDWVRLLAQESPRRHVIAACGAAAPPCVSGVPAGATAGFVSELLERAERWRRRGRARSAGRWLWAAAQGARRRGERALAAQIEIQWALHAADRDLLREADRCAGAWLPARIDWATYCDASAVRADVLITREAFVDARAWLTSLATEAMLRGVDLPGAIGARAAELDFWQGRSPVLMEPREFPMEPRVFRPGDSVFQTRDEAGWRAVGAWSRGDRAGLALIAGKHFDTARVNGRPCWWGALARVLMSSVSPEEEIASRIDALVRAGSDTPRARLRRLGLLIAARTWMTCGRADRAAPLLERARGPGPEGSAAAALRAQLVPRVLDIHEPAIRQPRPAPGVEFMASRSTSMHLVDGLSGLLAIVEDAEDEGLVLVGGCRWVCRQSGASAVGVVSADGGMLVAAEGWTRADLGGEIAGILRGPARDARIPGPDTSGAFGVSVRHAGLTIAYVVSRGLASERPRVQQAAQAFAALCGSAVRARLDAMAGPARARDLIPELVGDSPVMQGVRESVARAAVAPFPVLIEGESGTGKELVARALHRLGPRRDRKFCAVNCAALTDDLVEAELFGHVRGAFTGAIGPRTGLFEEASGGTLFLDEVAELSARAQAKLLRVLQEREIRRVGENASRAIDVRVMAATNAGLADAVAQGRFRDDLRFRLAVVRIRLPALRDRIEDVAPLARAFWRRAAGEAGTRATLAPDALARLARHGWPGNVRELQNVVSGLIVAAPPRGRVSARLVDHVIAQSGSPMGGEAPVVLLETARRTFERRVITAALVRHNGRRSAAAMELGLTRQGLTKALRRLGLSAEEDAAGLPADRSEAGVA